MAKNKKRLTFYESLRVETGGIISELLKTGGAEQIAHSLQERVKELTCLYGISELINQHGRGIAKILQGVADILPESWQYPEITCGRVTFEGHQYTTKTFAESEWRQTAPIKVGRNTLGSVDVFYLEHMPGIYEGPFLKEERFLIDAIADRLSKVIKRIQTEQQLEVERTSLKNMNIALSAVLDRAREEKREIAAQMQANVDQVIMPILYAVEQRAAPEVSGYVAILRQNLEDIVSPFISVISRQISSLSPAEIQICDMIRKGLSSKEIARLRGIAPSTINRHREHIRRKLDLTGKEVNLASYLNSLVSE